jgi:hypothetical protein
MLTNTFIISACSHRALQTPQLISIPVPLKLLLSPAGYRGLQVSLPKPFAVSGNLLSPSASQQHLSQSRKPIPQNNQEQVNYQNNVLLISFLRLP